MFLRIVIILFSFLFGFSLPFLLSLFFIFLIFILFFLEQSSRCRKKGNDFWVLPGCLDTFFLLRLPLVKCLILNNFRCIHARGHSTVTSMVTPTVALLLQGADSQLPEPSQSGTIGCTNWAQVYSDHDIKALLLPTLQTQQMLNHLKAPRYLQSHIEHIPRCSVHLTSPER